MKNEPSRGEQMNIPKNITGVGHITSETFRAGGKGGQKQNTSDSGARIRATITDPTLLQRLRKLFPSHVTDSDELLSESREERSQLQNKKIAMKRLKTMIAKARVQPKKRKATKPSYAAKKRRLESKRKRSRLKQHRKKPDSSDE